MLGSTSPAASVLLDDRSQALLEAQPAEGDQENSVRGLSASILQRFSAFAQAPPPEETLKCQVCLDDVPLSQTVVLSGCGHRDCKECVTLYLEVKIRDGQVNPTCFHQYDGAPSTPDTVSDPTSLPGRRACGVAISEEDIKMLVRSDIRAQYKTFRFYNEHDRGRLCPYCNHPQVCKGADDPMETCTKCSKLFCFTHGNAHEGKSCADYDRREAHNQLQSRATIQRTTKPCPKCAADIEKSGKCV